MTKEECLENGGHCWVDGGMVYLTDPPQYPQHCKHCPARRVGRKREPVEWREV